MGLPSSWGSLGSAGQDAHQPERENRRTSVLLFEYINWRAALGEQIIVSRVSIRSRASHGPHSELP
jgi:hypothetical protein